MRVIKRNNDVENVSFDKVLNRIRLLCSSSSIDNGPIDVDYYDVAQKVCSRIYDLVKTSELDELAANICSSMIADNPDYGILAARIIISNHHKNTSPSFSESITLLYQNVDMPLINEGLYEVVFKNKEKLNNYIDYSRDYTFDYFGFKTLERSYLLKINGKIIERPQQLFMRVALGIHGNDIKDALQTYDLMSKKFFTHATPTLFNAGTIKPQLSSCFLLSVDGDSIDKIFDTVKETAMISKFAGGIGIHVHDIRSKGSVIKGTNGISDGIVPMLKVLNQTARYVNQCFTPNTKVFSMRGAKRMDIISEDDFLLTNDMTYHKVNTIAISEVVDVPILNVRSFYSCDDVSVTPEHEICVLRNAFPQFIFAKELTEDEFVGYAIPEYERDVMMYDKEFCKFIGIIIGAASWVHRSFDNNVAFTLKMYSSFDALFVKKYLRTTKIHHLCYDDNGNFIVKFLGFNLFLGVKMIPSRFIHLPKEKILHVLQGIYTTSKVLCMNDTIELSVESKQVQESIRYMLLRIGIPTWGDQISNDEFTVCSHFHNDFKFIIGCEFADYQNSHYNLKYSHGMIWTKIKSISQTSYTGKLYDFNMKDNHNYTVTHLGIVHNSGKRNGSVAVYMEPWHADIFEFLDLKKPHGNEEDRARDLFYSLWIPDLFMERVKNNQKWSLMCPNKCPQLSEKYGDDFKHLYEGYESNNQFVRQVDAQQLWFKILDIQMESGGPYLLFKDAANMKSNQKNLGTIKSSNLCVAPETLILTDHGYFPIIDLRDKKVNVWNGVRFSKTIVRKTGSRKKLLTVSFSNGMSLRCTPYHRFKIETVSTGWIEAQDLCVGMRIIPFYTPTLNGKNVLTQAYTQGLFSSKFANFDKHGTPIIYLFNEKRILVNFIDWVYFHDFKDRIEVVLHSELQEPLFVPLNYDLKSRIKWLEGLVDGDGLYDHINETIRIHHDNGDFLKNILLMLQTLGIMSHVRNQCIIIDGEDVVHLHDLGFTPKFLPIKKMNHTPRTKYIKVIGIQDLGEFDDTYCFNEHKEHMGVFNGILTMNCSEIIEYSSPDETAVCNLASVCLPSYIELGVGEAPSFNFKKLHEVVMTITKNLNKVIDITYYPVEKHVDPIFATVPSELVSRD